MTKNFEKDALSYNRSKVATCFWSRGPSMTCQNNFGCNASCKTTYNVQTPPVSPCIPFAYPCIPCCKDGMDRAMIAYDCALIFDRYRSGSRHESVGYNHPVICCSVLLQSPRHHITGRESYYATMFTLSHERGSSLHLSPYRTKQNKDKMLRTTMLSFVYSPTVGLPEHTSTFGKIVKLIFLSLHSPCAKPVFGGYN